MLSGAGLMNVDKDHKVYVHMTAPAHCTKDGDINLNSILDEEVKICSSKPVFVMVTDKDGSFTGQMLQGFTVGTDYRSLNGTGVTIKNADGITGTEIGKAYDVLVDFYVEKESGAQELVIDAENFAGYYYVEASTLFRRQHDGKDLPAEIVFPNVKVQSNFTFNMAATGDPSTFTFTMDAMPGVVEGSADNKQVLCAIQIIDDVEFEGTATGGDSIS
jgi:hypothetical protein